MAKQRTDNLELVVIDDVDTDAFFPDLVENLNKINDADKQRQADIAGLQASSTAQAVAIALVLGA